MDKYYIPRYIDEPGRIVFFTIDEAILIGFILFVGFTVGYELISLIIAIIAYGGYKTFKGKEGSSFIKKRLYWSFNIGSRHLIPAATNRKYKG